MDIGDVSDLESLKGYDALVVGAPTWNTCVLAVPAHAWRARCWRLGPWPTQAAALAEVDLQP